MVTTNDQALAKRLRLLRSHGMTREPEDLQQPPEGPWVYEQQLLGFNYRMTDVQAALGLSQLTRMESLHAQRIALADIYDDLLQELPVIRPPRDPESVSSWHLYVIEIDQARCKVSRANMFRSLRNAGIGVNVHYIPIHLQPYFRKLGFSAGQFPNAEAYYARALTIPLYPALTLAQQQRVVGELSRALEA